MILSARGVRAWVSATVAISPAISKSFAYWHCSTVPVSRSQERVEFYRYHREQGGGTGWCSRSRCLRWASLFRIRCLSSLDTTSSPAMDCPSVPSMRFGLTPSATEAWSEDQAIRRVRLAQDSYQETPNWKKHSKLLGRAAPMLPPKSPSRACSGEHASLRQSQQLYCWDVG
ncbi:hypothetical protein VTI74DRAFT_1302 [Chaetomium olivicolor]